MNDRSIGQERDSTRADPVSERFTRAANELNKAPAGSATETEVRIQAIYALEQLVNDQPEHYYGPVMDVLGAYVRTHVPVPTMAVPPERSIELAPEVQAILTVIDRRSEAVRWREDVRIDLSRNNLSGADLHGASLEYYVDLKEAQLAGANFQSANLLDAHFARANLTGANFEHADMPAAHLEGADLSFARMMGET